MVVEKAPYLYQNGTSLFSTDGELPTMSVEWMCRWGQYKAPRLCEVALLLQERLPGLCHLPTNLSHKGNDEGMGKKMLL